MRRRIGSIAPTAAKATGRGKAWPQTRVTGAVDGIRLEMPEGTVTFAGAACTDVDLSHQRISNYLAIESTFVRCDFRGSVWAGGVLGDLPPVTYRDCDFSEADLRRVGPQYARFERCRFQSARMDDWNAMCAEFVDCTFAGRLVGVRFSGQPWGLGRNRLTKVRKTNAFTGNDLGEADLDDCSILGGIDLDANAWPTDGYVLIRDAPRRIASARRVLENWTDDEARTRAEAVLTAYSIGGFELQRDLFVEYEGLGPAGPLLVG